MPVHTSFWLQIAAWPWIMRTVTGDLHKADSWVHCCCSCSCSCCSCCSCCCCCCCSWSCTCVAALPDMCPVLVPLTVIAQVQTVLRLRPTFIVNSLWKFYSNIIILGLENGRPLFGLRCNLPEHWEASPPNSAALTVTLHDLLPSHFSWTLYIASLDSPRVFRAWWQM